MAGIYIHIPFCRQACYYCNFHFSTSWQAKNKLIPAIQQELFLQKDYLQQQEINTIYFGGGTPSLLESADINNILTTIFHYYVIQNNMEITLEANPDDITDQKLQELKSAGINRLSIGIQSFADAELKWMNRVHNSQQAVQSMQLSQKNGFGNFSVDLIYGTPNLTDEMWEKQVRQMIDLHIPHLSCYALTVEPSTALAGFIRQKKYPPIDSDKAARQFELLMDWMDAAGYEHYEISNFALPGFRSKHNSSYWQGTYYLGVGPSAHSYNGISRQWNIANNSLYIKHIEEGKIPAEKESLTPTMQLNEYIMTSLRTMEGCNLAFIEKKFGKLFSQKLFAASIKHQQQGKILIEQNHLLLTKKGKLFTDGIAAELFF